MTIFDANALDDSQLFSVKELRNAFESLVPVLGQSNVDALAYYLANFGLPLVDDRDSYNLGQIQAAIEKIFGQEATLLLWRYVTQGLVANRRA